MGRIRILSDVVANQIAAGEVVERPASVVKELLENSLDAGATRIRIEVEAGGRKLIRIADNGHGMVRDDALLAFERHATSKLRTSDDLLSIATLGFRGEALPSIASVSRLTLDTRASAAADEKADTTGTHIEIAGGNILRVEDAGLPPAPPSPSATSSSTPQLAANSSSPSRPSSPTSPRLSLTTRSPTPPKHFELHSATQALLVAPSVPNAADRLFQIFGRDTFHLMLPTAAEIDFAHAGLPELPPWRRDADYTPPTPGHLRLTGFVSKPELQKLNRNAVYVFVNQRLVRDKLILHALSDAYRNIIPPTSYPVVLLFLEMPPEEVDVNVHPAKTEVRFRQSSFIHDFVRDTVRTTLMQAAPPPASPPPSPAAPTPPLHPSCSTSAPLPGPVEEGRHSERSEEPQHFARGGTAFTSRPFFQPGSATTFGQSDNDPTREDSAPFDLVPVAIPESPGRLTFNGAAIPVGYPDPHASTHLEDLASTTGTPHVADTLNALSTLKPLGQLRDSFILATNEEGLWIIDQHVAHERILFERILRERTTESAQRQRLLMPILIDLLPAQMITFAEISAELERNGLEAEPFGPRTLAIKAAPVGLEGRELEIMLEELLSVPDRNQQIRKRRSPQPPYRRLHGLPRRHQDQPASRQPENRLAFDRARKNRASHRLSPRPPHRSAVFL